MSITPFQLETEQRITANGGNPRLREAARRFTDASVAAGYSYNFTWLGRPIIQYPQDMLAMQQLIYQVQPDLIIETGIAHGGSLIFSASMLELNAICGGPADAEVLAIDIDIRQHNRVSISEHPMSRRITMIQGSSVADDVVAQVRAKAAGKKRVLVALDSNHTHAHVAAELAAYAPLVTVGSYCVVFDTVIEDLPTEACPDRPWGPGDNPKTALWAFLKDHPEFQIDSRLDQQLMVSMAPEGYLKRVR